MRFRVSALLVGFALGGTALASPSPSPEPSGPGAAACKSLETACVEGGYSDSSREKNLQRDCIEPLIANRNVPGVSVKQGDVAACQKQRQNVGEEK